MEIGNTEVESENSRQLYYSEFLNFLIGSYMFIG